MAQCIAVGSSKVSNEITIGMRKLRTYGFPPNHLPFITSSVNKYTLSLVLQDWQCVFVYVLMLQRHYIVLPGMLKFQCKNIQRKWRRCY